MHQAYAKINLGLIVRDRRQDGFHNIETVFHSIDLFDEIELKQSSVVTVIRTPPEVKQISLTKLPYFFNVVARLIGEQQSISGNGLPSVQVLEAEVPMPQQCSGNSRGCGE